MAAHDQICGMSGVLEMIDGWTLSALVMTVPITAGRGSKEGSIYKWRKNAKHEAYFVCGLACILYAAGPAVPLGSQVNWHQFLITCRLHCELASLAVMHRVGKMKSAMPVPPPCYAYYKMPRPRCEAVDSTMHKQGTYDKKFSK